MPEAEPVGGPPFLLGAVVLAAGGSSRMGSAKQLLPLDGKPLIVRAVEAVLGSPARPVVVVLGSDAQRVREAIAGLPVHAVLNPDWPAGMASSIRAGLSAILEDSPGLDAVLVALCDQPALTPEVIGRLAEAHRSTGRIAAARYAGRNGAPAVFGRGHFEALGALTGDTGARALLNGDADPVAALDLPDFAADLDTPADVTDWRSRRP
jgi:molybdenum cofactor cytidylyltransferase